MTRTVLDIDGVSKNFGSLTAVDGVSLSIRENEFFALLGPSGCGKTTLLRMLAGFETPTSGKILLDGADVSRVPPNRRPVNLMFQSYALFPHMSVRGNISYGLEMERRPAAEIRARVDEMLATTQLGPLADRKPDQLSGGQKQRVALARALIKRPRVLLLDEPLGALDKKLRGEMQIELKRLQNEVGITFVVVTHDQEEALVMADRMAVLRDGRLLQCDTPHEVYEHPADALRRGLHRRDEFLLGRRPRRRRREGSRRFDHRRRAAARASPAARRRLPPCGRSGSRCSPPPTSPTGRPGTVEALAYHGLDLQLHIRTKLADKPFLVRVTADTADRRAVKIGDAVEIGWAAADTRIFKA